MRGISADACMASALAARRSEARQAQRARQAHHAHHAVAEVLHQVRLGRRA